MDFSSMPDVMGIPAPLWVPVIVLAAKLITVWTPTRSDDAVLDRVLGVLNLAALNVGRDKNADAER